MLCMFGNFIYFIDSNNEAFEYDFTDNQAPLSNCLPSGGKIVKDIDMSKSQYFNSILYAYLAVLGEYQIDNYEGTSDKALIWGAFFLLTFFVQIVFLNVIIAVMGDTYDRVS